MTKDSRTLGFNEGLAHAEIRYSLGMIYYLVWQSVMWQVIWNYSAGF
ncbi:hypothetical protein [Alkalimarinus coralli]|nr:hypothetical protein [Alkalimarinus coralli]